MPTQLTWSPFLHSKSQNLEELAVFLPLTFTAVLFSMNGTPLPSQLYFDIGVIYGYALQFFTVYT